MALSIREMKTKDIDAVYNMATGTRELHSSKIAKWYDKVALKKWLKLKRDDLLLVADYNGRVVGVCLCYVLFRRWALMDSITVDPKFRRKGIARKLTNEIISQLKKKGIIYAQALIKTNNKRTLSLMKKLGFNKGYSFYIVDKFLGEY